LEKHAVLKEVKPKMRSVVGWWLINKKKREKAAHLPIEILKIFLAQPTSTTPTQLKTHW
jgi:hypothetical protein